jgi:hypothetical protein
VGDKHEACVDTSKALQGEIADSFAEVALSISLLPFSDIPGESLRFPLPITGGEGLLGGFATDGTFEVF